MRHCRAVATCLIPFRISVLWQSARGYVHMLSASPDILALALCGQGLGYAGKCVGIQPVNFSGTHVALTFPHIKGKPVERWGRKTSGLRGTRPYDSGVAGTELALPSREGRRPRKPFASCNPTAVGQPRASAGPGLSRGRTIRGLHEESQTGVWVGSYCFVDWNGGFRVPLPDGLRG